jgi:hypothetical protein
LQVRVSSQVLVFSKTSFQAPKIFPRNPRAIYYSDRAAVGHVRGGDVLAITPVKPSSRMERKSRSHPEAGAAFSQYQALTRIGGCCAKDAIRSRAKPSARVRARVGGGPQSRIASCYRFSSDQNTTP